MPLVCIWLMMSMTGRAESACMGWTVGAACIVLAEATGSIWTNPLALLNAEETGVIGIESVPTETTPIAGAVTPRTARLPASTATPPARAELGTRIEIARAVAMNLFAAALMEGVMLWLLTI